MLGNLPNSSVNQTVYSTQDHLSNVTLSKK